MDWAGRKFGVQRSLQWYWAGRHSCPRQIAHAVFLEEAQRGKVRSTWWPGSWISYLRDVVMRLRLVTLVLADRHE